MSMFPWARLRVSVESGRAIIYSAPVTVSGTKPFVLHVVPFDEPRGAQRYARDLVDVLKLRGRHRILTLFAAEPAILNPDWALDVDQGLGRRLGLDPRVVFRLRRLIRRERPNQIVAHGGESAKYVALAAPREIPTVYLRVGTAKIDNPIRKLIHRAYTNRMDTVVAVSNDVADESAGLAGIDRGRIVVIPNARDPEVYKPATIREGAHAVHLIFIGHLDSGKRPEWFLDVVAEVSRRGWFVEATMIGDGPLSEMLRERADEIGVEMLGRRTDVAQILAKSDVLLFPGAPQGEGLPGVLIEAGLCGVPVVTTRVPGAAQVIEHGVTGYVVGHDTRELTDAVELLVGDSELRKRMGAAAREKCIRSFSFQATSDAWLKTLGTGQSLGG